MFVGDKAGNHGADDGCMYHRMQGVLCLRANLVKVETGFVEFVVGFDFPADAIEIRDLSWPNSAWEVG